MASKKPPKPPEDDAPEHERDDRTASMFGDDPPAQTGGAYQVLARKYRPSTFDELAGQEAMVRTLANAFRTGRIAHAFMLTGVRGVGKTTTARLLARALNFRTDTVDAPSMNLFPEGKGERHGPSIMAATHPDVLELDAASHTKVEEMRDLLDGSRYAPVSARYKVYIIDEVHMLSNHSFNALLKTLEEPPPHVKFIFATTEIRKVPVTVLSRCQRFNLQRFSTEGLADHLAMVCGKEGAKVSPEALALISRAAEGSARDALSILDQVIVQGDGSEVSAEQVRDMLGLADRSRVLDLMEAIVAGAHGDALKEAGDLLTAGADAQVLLKDLLDVATEVSRAQALKDAYTFAGPPDWAQRTKGLAAKLSPAQAARMWRMLLQGFEDCARAPDPSAAAQMVVLRLASVAALPPPEDGARLLAAAREDAAASRPEREAPRDPGGRSHSPSAHAGGAVAVGATARVPAPIASEEPGGPRLSSLRDILTALTDQRRIDLKYEIERYVRPAEIDYGHFHYTAAAGAPFDLSQRIRAWLEETSGVQWEVIQSAEAQTETHAERRRRREHEKLAEAASHPRVAEALKLFPGAQVVRVDEPESEDEFADADAGAPTNVIHVDFGGRDRVEPGDPGPQDADAYGSGEPPIDEYIPEPPEDDD